MLLSDIEVTSTNQSVFKPIAGRYILSGDALVVLQLDSRLVNVLKGELNGKVNSITVNHIMPETGISKYKKDLKELIKYIIFYQQNEIVSNNLFIMNGNSGYHQAAIEAVTEEQRKITKNGYELFPQVDKTCFNTPITEMNFVVTDPDDLCQGYFCEEPVVSTELEEIMMPKGVDVTKTEPYKSDGTYYEEVSSSSSSDSNSLTKPIQYKRVWLWEHINLNIKGTYAKSMGMFMTSAVSGSCSISIKRKMRPDEYGKVVR